MGSDNSEFVICISQFKADVTIKILTYYITIKRDKLINRWLDIFYPIFCIWVNCKLIFMYHWCLWTPTICIYTHHFVFIIDACAWKYFKMKPKYHDKNHHFIKKILNGIIFLSKYCEVKLLVVWHGPKQEFLDLLVSHLFSLNPPLLFSPFYSPPTPFIFPHCTSNCGVGCGGKVWHVLPKSKSGKLKRP